MICFSFDDLLRTHSKYGTSIVCRAELSRGNHPRMVPQQATGNVLVWSARLAVLLDSRARTIALAAVVGIGAVAGAGCSSGSGSVVVAGAGSGSGPGTRGRRYKQPVTVTECRHEKDVDHYEYILARARTSDDASCANERH